MKYFLVQERYIPKLPNLDYQIHIYQRSRLDYFKAWYKHYLFHWHGNHSKFYIPWNEYETLMARVKDIGYAPSRYKRFIDFFYRYISYDPSRIFKRAEDLLEIDPKKLSDKALARIITKESIDFFVRKWYWLHLPPFFYGFEIYLKEIMEKHSVSETKIGKSIATLSIPTKPSANSRQEVDFLKLILFAKRKGLNSKEVAKKLIKHYKLYRYAVSAFGNRPFTLKELKKYVLEYQNQKVDKITRRIHEILHTPPKAKKTKQKILKLLTNEKGVRIASDLLSGMAYIRERNKEALGKVLYVFSRLYAEVARRAAVPVRHTDYYLLKELGELLLKKKRVSTAELQRRRKCMVILSEHNRYKKFLSGGRAHSLFTKEIEVEFVRGVAELKGTCGNAGFARGVVSVINSPSDVPKMKLGNILVAPYTDHELVPAMRKAAAIVTDEGGILAHAAVISREFGTPCVITTEIATKVFKDGDLVEVDAEKGIVRIIKRAVR